MRILNIFYHIFLLIFSFSYFLLSLSLSLSFSVYSSSYSSNKKTFKNIKSFSHMIIGSQQVRPERLSNTETKSDHDTLRQVTRHRNRIRDPSSFPDNATRRYRDAYIPNITRWADLHDQRTPERDCYCRLQFSVAV